MRTCTCTIAFVICASLAAAACDLGDSPRRPRVVTTDVSLLVADTTTIGNGGAGHLVVWWSGDTTVVTVDSAGLLYGVARGRTTVVGAGPYDTVRATVTVDTTVGGWRMVADGGGVWADGRSFVWRWSDLGIPPQTAEPVPNAPAFKAVVLGVTHNCGVTLDDQVSCWFWNDFGQFGDGTTTSSDVPVPATGGHHFVSVAVGGSHTCALTDSGEAWCWGANLSGQLGVDSLPMQVCLNRPCSLTPVRVAGGQVFRALAGGGDEDQVPGGGHTCGITPNGDAYCWGWNGWGQLGAGDQRSRSTPVPVIGGHHFSAIAAGATHTCGIAEGGIAYCWGSQVRGELGTTEPDDGNCRSADIIWACLIHPAMVSGPYRFRAITSLGWTTCGLTTEGAAVCWGFDFALQLGRREVQPPPGSYSNTPAPVVGGLTFDQIAGGGSLVCGRTPRHAIYCWGNGLAVPMRMPEPQ